MVANICLCQMSRFVRPILTTLLFFLWQIGRLFLNFCFIFGFRLNYCVFIYAIFVVRRLKICCFKNTRCENWYSCEGKFNPRVSLVLVSLNGFCTIYFDCLQHAASKFSSHVRLVIFVVVICSCVRILETSPISNHLTLNLRQFEN